MGFDDIATARYLRPPLTTVHVDAYELGARAVHLLTSMGRPSGPTMCSHEILPTRLVVRQSCGSGLRRPLSIRPGFREFVPNEAEEVEDDLQQK